MRYEMLDTLKIGIALIDKELCLKYINRYMEELISGDITDFEKIQKSFSNAFRCKNVRTDTTCGTDNSCQRCDISPLLKEIYEERDGIIFDLDIFSDRLKIARKGNFECRGYSVIIEGDKYIQLELHEVSEKRKLEKNLQFKEASQKKLETFLDKIGDFIFYTDNEGKLEYCNNSYLKFLGKSYEEIIGKSKYDSLPKHMAEIFRQSTIQTTEKGTFFQEEKIDERWYRTFKVKIELEDQKFGILGIIRDVTLQKNREIELREKVYIDILTGIFNRNFIEEHTFSDSEYESKLSVILFDIDDFKNINDSYGHEAGDLVLKSIADIIKDNIRKDDYAIRFGGDEFLVITHSDISDAKKIADKILNSVRDMNFFEGSISLSIGIAENKINNKDMTKIIRDADIALYDAKNSGKNKISF
ncbi:MAG: diguanylate cyclase [Fusobacteriaceae bacterium]